MIIYKRYFNPFYLQRSLQFIVKKKVISILKEKDFKFIFEKDFKFIFEIKSVYIYFLRKKNTKTKVWRLFYMGIPFRFYKKTKAFLDLYKGTKY